MWSALGKYKSIVVSIALFLLLDASVLTLNFYISFKIADDAVGVNLAGRQRMLSQRTVKSLYEIEAFADDDARIQTAEQELRTTFGLFNRTLEAFDRGGAATGANGNDVVLKAVTSAPGRAAIEEAKRIWKPYHDAIDTFLTSNDSDQRKESLDTATAHASALNLNMLKLMNDLTVDLENVATSQATTLRYIQTGGISLAIVNFLIILFHFIGELRRNDRQLEAARQETTEILNTVNEGLFLLDKDLRLGSQHSAQLSQMFGGKQVTGITFEQLIGDLVKAKTLETARRFVALLFRPNVKSNLIKDLNPLSEVELNIPDQSGGYITRYLNFDFSRVNKGNELESVLVTVNDVTRSVLLAAELAAAKEKSEQQMEVLTSLLHTDPKTLKRFIQGAFDSFTRINQILKDQTKSESGMHNKLNSIFVEVHNFKGDASALELDTFTDLAHTFEDDIEALRKRGKITGNDFLGLTVHLESLIRYTESVQEIAEKLANFSIIAGEGKAAKAALRDLTDSSRWQHLHNLCGSVAEREAKQVHLVLTGFNETTVDAATEHFINDVSIQFIRNAIVHSVETPDARAASGKSAYGRIDARLVHLPSGELELSVRDDGTGINYDKIRDRALAMNRWDAAEVLGWSNKKLLSLIFESGFSTAEATSEDAGRGVGMDVIRSRVNSLNGKMKIASRSGLDCQFTVTLPAAAAAGQDATIAA